MTLRSFLACGLMLPGLAGCAGDAVKPSPTSDQVMTEQYRAQGARSALSGAEAQAITDAYHRDIAKPAAAAPSNVTETGAAR